MSIQSYIQSSRIWFASTAVVQARALNVRWAEGRRGGRVPLVESPYCGPDLVCQRLSYILDSDDQENTKERFIDIRDRKPVLLAKIKQIKSSMKKWYSMIRP